MEIETVLKVIVSGVALFGIWKFFYQIKSWKKSYFRDEYKFSKEFLGDIDNKEINLHPYSVEKGYQAIAGTDTVKAQEVEYILSLEDPLQCLDDYILSRQLMEKIDTKGDLKVRFKKRYSFKLYRTWLKAMYTFFYIFFAFLAISPFLAQDYFGIPVFKMFTYLVFTLPFGGIYAWAALNAFSKIRRGEHLVCNQSQHTQRVILKT
ncbi:hypothetical protein [Halioxenophilus aromaticivorans]|uniref:Uncharacterized protein n=1 Tax=Halioxenophilus aromaticivorans TaxID=1306992 RepID=A0AAV3U8K1_9ALTE